ncbi:unnamed protein product [Lepidochelys kempii]
MSTEGIACLSLCEKEVALCCAMLQEQICLDSDYIHSSYFLPCCPNAMAVEGCRCWKKYSSTSPNTYKPPLCLLLLYEVLLSALGLDKGGSPVIEETVDLGLASLLIPSLTKGQMWVSIKNLTRSYKLG